MSDFRQTYCRSEIHQKARPLKKHSENSKIIPLSALNSILSFWEPLCLSFSMPFRKTSKPRILQHVLFGHLKASRFCFKFIRTKCFSRRPPGHFFNLMLILCENDRFGETFQIQRAPKWDPKSTEWRQHVEQKYTLHMSSES